MSIYLALVKAGYCDLNNFKMHKLIGKGKKNQIFVLFTFETHSSSNFRWLYDIFYKNDQKFVPKYNDLYELFTPLTLATLFLSSLWVEEKAINTIPKKFKICFPIVGLKQLDDIAQVLKLKYSIETTIRTCFAIKGVTQSSDETRVNNDTSFCALLIKNSSRSIFSNVIKSGILPSLHPFLNRPNLRLGVFQVKRSLVTWSFSRPSSVRCRNEIFSIINNKLLRMYSNQKELVTIVKYTDLDIIEWLRGFTDAEGSFGIFKNNSAFSFKFQAPSATRLRRREEKK